MADESKSFKLIFETSYQGEGAKASKADIEQVTAATEKQTAANEKLAQSEAQKAAAARKAIQENAQSRAEFERAADAETH